MKTKAKTLWFRAKGYGWGWYPITWQGWALTTLFAIAYTLSFIAFLGWLGTAQEAGIATTRQAHALGIAEFVVWVAFITYVMVRLCYRYGESPSWRWGKRK